MFFSRFAQAAALLLLTIGFAAPVHAQNNKQIISGTWYEDRANTTFSGTSLNLGFTQTPTNQFLNFTNVSCVVDNKLYPSTNNASTSMPAQLPSVRPWQALFHSGRRHHGNFRLVQNLFDRH